MSFHQTPYYKQNIRSWIRDTTEGTSRPRQSCFRWVFLVSEIKLPVVGFFYVSISSINRKGCQRFQYQCLMFFHNWTLLCFNGQYFTCLGAGGLSQLKTCRPLTRFVALLFHFFRIYNHEHTILYVNGFCFVSVVWNRSRHSKQGFISLCKAALNSECAVALWPLSEVSN